MRFFERPKNNTNTPQSLSFWETFKEWLGNASGLPGNAKLESLDGPIVFAKEPAGIPQHFLHAPVDSGSGDVWAWMLRFYRDSCGRRVGDFNSKGQCKWGQWGAGHCNSIDLFGKDWVGLTRRKRWPRRSAFPKRLRFFSISTCFILFQ